MQICYAPANQGRIWRHFVSYVNSILFSSYNFLFCVMYKHICYFPAASIKAVLVICSAFYRCVVKSWQCVIIMYPSFEIGKVRWLVLLDPLQTLSLIASYNCFFGDAFDVWYTLGEIKLNVLLWVYFSIFTNGFIS